MPILSIVVPVFNEEAVLLHFFQNLVSTLNKSLHSYEVIFIDDGSSDGSYSVINDLVKKGKQVKAIKLSRNFGKEAAMTAGIEMASGQCVVIIDADMQHPPELILELIKKWEEGSQVVIAIRKERNFDSALKRQTARWFYRVLKKLSPIDIPKDAGDFRLMDRQVIDVLRQYPERSRFMKGLFAHLGFPYSVVYFNCQERMAGKTKFSYWKLWNFAIDGIVSFSSVPLRLWSYIGGVIATIALIYGLIIIGKTLIIGGDVPGYPSLAVMILFFSGVQLIGIGVLGEYLARIFTEVKQRPIYIIEKKNGFDET